MPSVPKPITLTRVSEIPSEQLPEFYADLHARASETRSVFISLTPLADLQQRLAAVTEHDPQRRLQFHAVPYVVKDNIDAPPHATTNGCPVYKRTPDAPAPVVESLEAAGAIMIGKTNMDQFATGLVGTRSPYGIVYNVHDTNYSSGGSSSGSATAVALGLAAIGLGTDTAGSGRVPAAMLGLVGVKPTKGIISTRGVVPACASLDCVSVFANSVSDAATVTAALIKDDPLHPYSRPLPVNFVSNYIKTVQPQLENKSFRFGIPTGEYLDFQGDTAAENSFASSVALLEAMGGVKETIDFSVFAKVGSMLYEGAFVAERFDAVGRFIKENIGNHVDAFDQTVSSIILDGEHWPAHTVFSAQNQVRMYCKQADAYVWPAIDVLVVPSIPCAFTVDQIKKEPVKKNAVLGKFTNFVNLMDYCAIAVPAPTPPSETCHVPRGCTFIAKAFCDSELVPLALRFEKIVCRCEGVQNVI